LAGFVAGLAIGITLPEEAGKILLILATGTGGAISTYQALTSDPVRQRLPETLVALIYTATLFLDWAGHAVTLASLLRTGAVWGISFTAGFAVGFLIGATTHYAVDGAIWAVERILAEKDAQDRGA
jgi:hypothetical protein